MVRAALISVILILLIMGCRKSEYETIVSETITDDGGGTGNVTWVEGRNYIIEGLVFVNDGQTLIIEPGTVIRGKTGQAEKASALIVARGGRIIAGGTAEKPIIFTVEGDDLQGSIPYDAQGLWGGLIILGNAPLNVNGNEASIEGIPITEPRGVFGGPDSEDNSGILQYVSIRHSGTNIGEGNEINGLTLGGVGNGTTIDRVEIIANADDGIEFFGGTVNCSHMAVAFCGDDAFDFDMGYQGFGQYWLAIQDLDKGNLICELDGSPSHPANKPFTRPVVFNLTAIGRGLENPAGLISFVSNAAGIFANSIFVSQQWGIRAEYTENTPNCIEQWQNDELEIKGNTFWDVAFNTHGSIFSISGDNPGNDIINEWQNYFALADNQIKDPGIGQFGDKFVIFPAEGFSGVTYDVPDAWFEVADYAGAFKNYNWLLGWSSLSQEGIIELF